jgi:hypothetical protein
VVAISQRIAAELVELLKGRLGDETVTCVISASATDDPAILKWRRSRQERRQVDADFKDLILEQARELYRFWPEVYLNELPI